VQKRRNRVKRIAVAALAVASLAAAAPATSLADGGSVQNTSEPGGGGTGP